MKRIFDFLVASFVLLFFSIPVLALILFVGIRIGWPAIFRQVRPGLDGKPFLMFKLRTMSNECDSEGRLLPDTLRLSPFGRKLRASSIDEIPSLWNVLKGDMSLVGPRPLLMDYLPLYSSAQARRHDARPGVTGWAQVNGRNAISWEEKFKLDVWYIENRSMWLDLKILLLTVRKVLIRDGISAAGEATMPRFLGTQNGERK